MNHKDLSIYQEIANVAKNIFNNIVCPAGKYTPQDIAKYIQIEETKEKHPKYDTDIITGCKYTFKTDSPFSWAADFDPLQKYAVSVDTFSCGFNAWGVFSILKKVATAWGIAAAYKVEFIRKAETAPVAVSFSVPAVAKDLVKTPAAVAKETPEKIIYTFVAVDTRRRALIVTNGILISAVAVSDMFVSEDAAAVYLISPELIKTGKGSISIDTAGTAANDTGVSFPVSEDAKQFPRWERVLPAVSEYQRINIGNKVFSNIKKEIAAVAKQQKQSVPVVCLSGTAGVSELLIKYAISWENDTVQTRRVSLPQPCPFDFSVPVAAKRLAAVPVAESIYISGFTNRYSSGSYSGANIVFTANENVSLLIPTLDKEHETEYKITFPVADSVAAEDAQPAAVLKVCNFPAVAEDAQETPAAAVQDAPETANVPAADSLPADNVSVAEDAPETPAVAANSAYYTWGRIDLLKVNHYMKIVATKYTYGRPYSDNSISQAETLLSNTGIILNNDTFVSADSGRIIARIKKEMKKDICVSVDIVWLSAEETIYQDAQPAAAQEKETPAVFAKVDQYAVNNENGNAVIFETYAPQLGTDEETPAAAADSVSADSVPVAAAADSVSVAAEDETPAVLTVCPADEETPAVAAADSPSRGRRRYSLRPWLRNAAAVAVLIVCAVLIGWERETPAAAADSVPVADSPAVAVPVAADSLSLPVADSLPADSVSVAENAQETANVETPAADSVPAQVAPATAAARDTLETIGEITAPADTATAAAPSLETAGEITAAPADDDTQTGTDGDTVPATSSPATSTGTTAPAAVGSAAAAGAISPAVLALLIYIL